MKCRQCIPNHWRKPEGWPCVFEHTEIYEAYERLGSTRSSHFFLTMEDMAAFVETQPEEAMFRLFQRNIDSGEVIEFT